MSTFTKRTGDNFDSWEERIDYQLAFAHSRADMLRDRDRTLAGQIGELHGRIDGLERRHCAAVQALSTRLTWALGVAALGWVGMIALAVIGAVTR